MKKILFTVTWVLAAMLPLCAQTAGHGPVTIQVTIGAAATQIATVVTPARQVIVQNNAAHNIRVGDSNTSSSRGALLASGSPGGSINLGPFANNVADLSKFYIAGTQNDVIDVIIFQ